MTSLVPIGGLAKIDRPTLEPIATEMARIFHHSIARISAAMDTIESACEDMHGAFLGDEDVRAWDFSIGYDYRGDRNTSREVIFGKMKRTAWSVLTDRIGVKNVMSMEKRKEFEKQLHEGELPDITPETIISVIMGLVEQAGDFSKEAVKEAFEFLRNRRGDYKTNLKYRVGKKVIIEWAVEPTYKGFSPSHYKDDFYRALDGVMLVLDGKTPLRTGRTAIGMAIYDCKDGRAETDYFKLKCYKNRNLHLEFKRLDLLRQLNLIATGSAEIGDDER